MNQITGKFTHGDQDETPPVAFRMRNYQVIFPQKFLAVKNYIQVDKPGTPALGFLASHHLLCGPKVFPQAPG